MDPSYSYFAPEPSPSALITPPLWNKKSAKSHPKIYAIPLTIQVMDRFMKIYEPDLPRGGTKTLINFQKSAAGYLPPEARRVTFLHVPNKGYDPLVMLGIVIASNMSEEELELARNAEVVRKVVQEVHELLCIDTPVAWYRFGEP
ncbi:hypothetical protein MD484_g7413, partial [Candolleomyces efflorescens]